VSRPQATWSAIIFFLLLGTALAQQPVETSAMLGRRITAVDIRGGDIPISPEKEPQFRARLPKIGETLTRSVIRNGIQSLYSTLEFSDVSVEALPDGGDGVKLTFVVRNNFFVGAMRVEGAPRPPTASQVINAAKLQLGNLFIQDDLDAAVTNIRKLMAENGYYRSQVQVRLDQQPTEQLVNVTFVVIRGEKARVGAVNITGNPGFTAEEVRNIAKMHPGDSVSTARVNRALTRLRKKYQKQDRLEAQVAIVNREYHPDTNKLDYTFRIDRGDKVDIHVEGAKIRKGLVKKYVPVYEENAVDDDLLNEGRRNIRDYFQSKGYFDNEVDFRKSVDEADGHKSVVFEVQKGQQRKLTSLIITGNKYFREDTIRERMRIAPASLLLYYGRFSQTMLARDVQSIESLYAGSGFLQVKITPKVADDPDGKSGHLRVTIIIDEGPQTLVENFSIEGIKSFSADEINPYINTSAGQPFAEITVATDRDAITNFYFNRGFPDVRLEAFIDPVPGKTDRMNVKYVVTEGTQEFVNRVIVTGLEHTKRFVVDRELDVHSGAPLSQADMLNTQQKLYDVGVFNEVNVAVQNPQGAERNKNVVIQTAEARRYTFTYGFGLEVQTGDPLSNCKDLPNPAACQPEGRTGVSPRVSFDVTRLNFLGRDYTLLFKSRVGRLQQRVLLSFEAPRVLNSINKTITFTSFFDKTRDVRTFTAERLEGSVQLQHVINKGTQMLYRIVYRRVQVDPKTLQVDPNLIPLLSRPVRVAFPSVTYIRDTRNDPIDSYRGVYTTSNFDIASSIFGSESNFARLVLSNSSYHIIKKSGPERQWVLARATRIGIEEPFGSFTQAFVPLPERFFAGGSNSHRGFAINQAGPRDLETGFPIGGNALFINNIELRTPPVALPFVEENLSFVFFHDAGNVFTSTEQMVKNLWRFSQPQLGACKGALLCNFDFMSHAVGTGLRYKTPIGPVRFDLGYNLNPPFYAQGNINATKRLGRFNFFFSIGQTF
jgi:outer membrane protein assembly complex protein YaeT